MGHTWAMIYTSAYNQLAYTQLSNEHMYRLCFQGWFGTVYWIYKIDHMHITAGVCSTIRERGCVWSLPVFIRGVERCSITALDNHSHPHLLFWDHVWTLKLNRKITAPWEERTQQQEVNCSVTEFFQSQVFFTQPSFYLQMSLDTHRIHMQSTLLQWWQ